MKVYVILAAGGSGSRMGADKNKILLTLLGTSIIVRSIRLFDGIIDGMVLVTRKEDISFIQEEIRNINVSFPIQITEGGITRQSSVLNGLRELKAEDHDIVLIHDAARCLAPRELVLTAIQHCKKTGSSIPGIPAVNTIKIWDDDHHVLSTPERSSLCEIQTPQAFLFGLLYSAYLKAESDGFQATDDSSVLEHAGYPVFVFPGSRKNIKITEKEDLLIAKAMLQMNESGFRVGLGYDVHRLVKNRKLILCGIEIPYSLGLLGHSDADVALHALMDAMLGAAALGDIGKFFPDTSSDFKDISSLILLDCINKKIHCEGYTLMNADITITAQCPKLAPYIDSMRSKIAETLSCDLSQISVKATTTEKLGFEGREEGISAQAVCLLKPMELL